MIRSMTGFGKGSERCSYGDITVEIKALNHKSLSVSCNSFSDLFLLEEKIKDIFEDKVFRGKIFIRIAIEGLDSPKSLTKVEVNEGIAEDYLGKVKSLQEKLGLKGDIGIKELVNFPGVIEKSTLEEGKIWPYIEKALKKALENLIGYRKEEGSALAKDFSMRLQKIKEHIKQIKKYGKQSVASYREKLEKTIRELAENTKPDKGRLEAEVALFAKNCDIAEEITRLEGHSASYKKAMSGPGVDVGKKLDFIAQEMQREANTIGAKASNFNIAKAVIEVKSEVERMREQIKNIE